MYNSDGYYQRDEPHYLGFMNHFLVFLIGILIFLDIEISRQICLLGSLACIASEIAYIAIVSYSFGFLMRGARTLAGDYYTVKEYKERCGKIIEAYGEYAIFRTILGGINFPYVVLI